MSKKTRQPPPVFAFDEFLKHVAMLGKSGIDISQTGQKCARDYNTNWHNLQGHVKQAFYGAQRFLQENPAFIARIAQSNIGAPYSMEREMKKAWIGFLRTHRREKASDYNLGVLYNQTPVEWGGRTTTGGGGFTYVPRSFAIVARMMLSGPYAKPDLLADPEGESSKQEIKRRKETILRRVRDTEKVRELKKMYDYCCQVCRAPTIQIGPREYYAEGHHLRPLGKPHDGDDHESNIIILCPNHHVMFDHSVMTIDPKDGQTVLSKFTGPTKLLLRHKLNPENILYHYKSFISG
jgi:hypothetical protein